MPKNKYDLILASQSPRRKELISWLEIPFRVIPSVIEEKTEKVFPHEVVQELSFIKGEDVFNSLKEDKTINPFVVSSDTIVCLDDKIYGKPKDKVQAREYLLELSNKTHRVLTAVSMFFSVDDLEQNHTFFRETQVSFNKIDHDILENYINSEESLDKAGAYGIQKMSLTFVSNINGSYSNVVGFPLSDFVLELKKVLGFENDSDGKWRECFTKN